MLTIRDKELRMDLDDFNRSFVLEVSDHLIYCHPVSSDDEALSLRKALTLQGRKYLPLVYCDIASVQGLIASMTSDDNEHGKSAIKAYCTQNSGDCSTCSLKNYNRDCHNNPIDKAS